MQSNSQQEEMNLLELRLKVLTTAFDSAIGKDMVLGDVKRLFHELKILSAQLLDLRSQHAGIDR